MDKELKEFYRRIGLTIAYYRRKAGMTQEALAQRLGYEINTISRVENAAQRVTLDFIYKMSALLDVSPSQFFSFKD